MSVPDFTAPFLAEIDLARRINSAAYEIVPNEAGAGQRENLAVALALVALEHIGAILSLFANRAITSGYALMRPALETSYKCVWIAVVASEAEVARAYAGKDVYGDLKIIIRDLEAEFQGTHSGGEPILARLKALNMKAPEYDFGKIISDIRTLAATAILTTIPIAVAADVEKLNALMRSNYSFLIPDS